MLLPLYITSGNVLTINEMLIQRFRQTYMIGFASVSKPIIICRAEPLPYPQLFKPIPYFQEGLLISQVKE
jgi:hypothetical protein